MSMPHPAPLAQESTLSLIDRLVREGAGVNLERSGGRWRLRCRQRDPATGRSRRLSHELPDDPSLLSEVRERVERQRRRQPEAASERRNAREARAMLAELRRKVQRASGRGRDVKKRIGWMFNMAATMGMDVLEDLIAREPWLARGKPVGRPRKAPRV